MPSVRTNGITIAYDLDGDGDETIVLVNGLADDRSTWAGQLDDLRGAGYRVLRYDNRGIGGSDVPPGPYTTRTMADDAKGLLDALDLRDVHMVGVSMGGMIAQEYALAYPDDLRSVTLACTYAAPGPFCGRMFALWDDLARREGLETVMRDVELWLFTLAFFEERPDEVAEFEATLPDFPQTLDGYLAQLASIRAHDASSRLGAIGTPTLVLAGEEDILIPVELSRRLCAAIPAAEWTTVPGGHGCMWEHPAPFNAAVLDFVGRRRAAATA
jgi:3-oxoadipate enol-lactonase